MRSPPYLQPSVQRPLNSHTLAGMSPVGGDGRDEGVELVLLLFQLFHQALDGPFGKRLALPSLPVAHQAVHDAQAGVAAGGGVDDGHPDIRPSRRSRRKCVFLTHITRSHCFTHFLFPGSTKGRKSSCRCCEILPHQESNVTRSVKRGKEVDVFSD